MTYHYCPTCGEPLITKAAGDDGNVPYCQICQKFWFDIFGNCVIVLIANELQELVLVQMPYLSTQYESFVSGYMKPGETTANSTRREVREELGITLDHLTAVGTYWFAPTQVLMHGFIAMTHKQPLHRSSELSTAHWIDAIQAHRLMLPDQPGLAATELYKKYRQSIQNKSLKFTNH